jgi:hypothetical protein
MNVMVDVSVATIDAAIAEPRTRGEYRDEVGDDDREVERMHEVADYRRAQ